MAVSLGVIFPSLLYFGVPSISFWRSNLLYSMVIACALLVGVRALLGWLLRGERFKRRVAVFGAARIRTLAEQPGIVFVAAGFIAMAGASEVVLALDERRNALPLADLLRVRTAGVQVSEYSTFLERETGRIDLSTVNPSWLISSDGLASGRMLSSAAKRAFHIVASLLRLAVAWPVLLVAAIAIKLDSRGPVLNRQRCVGLSGQGFDILKLRSMRTDAGADGWARWAARTTCA